KLRHRRAAVELQPRQKLAIDAVELALAGDGAWGSRAFSDHGSEINFYRSNNQKIYSAEGANIRINILCSSSRSEGEISMASSGAAAARLDARQASERMSVLREKIRAATVRSEPEAVKSLLETLAPVQGRLEAARERATHWVEVARADKRARPLVDSVMEQFPLDSAQGKALMGLAEALLRTPDPQRADQLISERLATIRGAGATGSADMLLRTAFTLLGSASRLLPEVAAELSGRFSLASVTKPLVAPIVRRTLRSAMEMLGDAFIVGETIEAALKRGKSNASLSLCSFDVLGEGARTEADAQRYADSYAAAIQALSHQSPGTVHSRSSISVKLSALEPRYSLLQSERVSERLIPRMLELARQAARIGIGLTIDAEEADRLDLSLDIVEALARDPDTRAWDGLGLAIQAYGRRAP